MAENDRIKYYRFLRERIRSYESAFKSFIAALRSRFNSRITVILFGSRARGDNKESSDFDIIVITTDDVHKLDFIEELYSLKPNNVPVDIIVLHKRELRDRTVKKMLSESRILYDGLKIFSKVQ